MSYLPQASRIFLAFTQRHSNQEPITPLHLLLSSYYLPILTQCLVFNLSSSYHLLTLPDDTLTVPHSSPQECDEWRSRFGDCYREPVDFSHQEPRWGLLLTVQCSGKLLEVSRRY